MQEVGVRGVSVWERLLGLEQAVVDEIEVSHEGTSLVARVHLDRRSRLRCSRCLRTCARYDRGGGRRRWRHLDAGLLKVWIEAEAPRVSCPACGVCVAYMPWAHAGTGHTLDFDHQVAWLATHMSKTAVVELMRIAWRTVGAIITRFWADIEDCFDRFDRLRRIGIDEISYKKGHKYLTVVVDHDTGRLVWAGIGREAATLGGVLRHPRARTRARRSRWSPRTPHPGSPPPSPRTARTRSAAPTRSTSWPGPPKPSIPRCAATPGTPQPAAPARPSCTREAPPGRPRP